MTKPIKSVLIIFNPNAGRRLGEKYAERIRVQLNKKGITDIEVFRSHSLEVLAAFFANYKKEKKNFDACVIIGGDGTLGPITHAMVSNGVELPICAFGRGTANDVPTYYKTQTSVSKFVNILLEGKTVKHDLVLANGQVAINIACGGAFTNGVTKYSKKAKKVFGKLAYYVGALRRAFTIPVQRVLFNVDGKEIDAECFMFTIGITNKAAGFQGISGRAIPNDGLLDLAIIKKTGFFGKICLGLGLLFKRVYKSKNVIYIQAKHIRVIPQEPITKTFTLSDMDGTAGPAYPLDVAVYSKQIDIIIK